MEQAKSFLEKQPVVAAQLLHGLKHARLAHAYLFAGDKGTGKHEVALWLAKSLFCLNPLEDGQPCEHCNNCQRINEGNHPDVLVIEPDGQNIKVEQIRNLQAEFSRSGFESDQRIFILKEAEKMNISAANSLLKFLEEPSGKYLAILETSSIGRILPTIQSRCQLLHFQALSPLSLQELLIQEGIHKETAQLLTSLTNSFEKAVEISKDEWFNEARDSIAQWFEYLVAHDPQSLIYVQKKLVKTFKEKTQQVQGLTILMHYYQKYLEQMVRKQDPTTIQQANYSLQLILEAEQKLTANVSFQNVSEQLAIRITNLRSSNK